MSKAIYQEVILNTDPAHVYQVLTDAEQFSQLTGGAPTEISAEAGGTFSCFGNMITGRNVELVPNRRIVQAWRVANWDEGVYSIVNFELQEQETQTLVVLQHVGFPENQYEHLATGWNENYWKPLKKLFA